MFKYFTLLEKLLTEKIVKNKPYIHRDYLKMKYGLDGFGERSAAFIANYIQCSESRIEYIHRDVQIFMRSEVGHTVIREAAIESVRILVKTGKL